MSRFTAQTLWLLCWVVVGCLWLYFSPIIPNWHPEWRVKPQALSLAPQSITPQQRQVSSKTTGISHDATLIHRNKNKIQAIWVISNRSRTRSDLVTSQYTISTQHWNHAKPLSHTGRFHLRGQINHLHIFRSAARIDLYFSLSTGWSGSAVLHSTSLDQGKHWSGLQHLLLNPLFNYGVELNHSALATRSSSFYLPLTSSFFHRELYGLHIKTTMKHPPKLAMSVIAPTPPGALGIVKVLKRRRLIALFSSPLSRAHPAGLYWANYTSAGSAWGPIHLIHRGRGIQPNDFIRSAQTWVIAYTQRQEHNLVLYLAYRQLPDTHWHLFHHLMIRNAMGIPTHAQLILLSPRAILLTYTAANAIHSFVFNERWMHS